MLRELSRGELTVSELADPFAMSLAAASKHIKALESAGLLQREVRGRTHVCRLEPAPLAEAHDWLGFYERFWNCRLDILEQLLRADDAKASAKQKTKSSKPKSSKTNTSKPKPHRKGAPR